MRTHIIKHNVVGEYLDPDINEVFSYSLKTHVIM